LLALLLTACGSASELTEEAASAKEATAIAEAVTTMRAATVPTDQPSTETSAISATLNSDYENAAPILQQIIIGIYQLENTDQAVTTTQAQEFLTLLTSLKDISACDTATQEQVDALVEQATSVLTPEQIQAIAAMQITQGTTMTVMQALGLNMGGPGQENGNAPGDGMGQPPQSGTPPASDPGQGGQPPTDGQMGTPPTDGAQRNTGFISPELLDAMIEFLQTKITS